jgi:uncharacterized protein (DUF1697 family)
VRVQRKTGERQVALLRGVNVGRANRVAMADLRTLVSDLGLMDVSTLLNSGNVVFTSPRGTPRHSAARIEKALKVKLGVTSRVIALSAGELADVIARNPLLAFADDPSRLIVAVLADPSDRSKLAQFERQDWGSDSFAVGPRAAYLWCAEGLIASKLNAAVNKALGEGVTSRNWATILKLRAMLDGEGEGQPEKTAL